MKQFLFLLVIWIVLQLPTQELTAQASHNSNAPLIHYYAIKNALVAGDANNASQAAADFLGVMESIRSNSSSLKLSPEIFSSLNDASASIKSNKVIARQRDAFAKLSQAMIEYIKLSKPAEKVYIDYCPMKKASWLSADQAIKNPYYGSSMLTCGKVTETIQ